MRKIIITVGPPGCGKTKWSIDYLLEHPTAKHLNRDDMRRSSMLSIYNAEDEVVLKRIRDYAVESWLNKNYDVIIDDTNLTPDVFPRLCKIADRLGDVSVEEIVFKEEKDICWNRVEKRNSQITDQFTPQISKEVFSSLYDLFIQKRPNDVYYAPPRYEREMMLDEFEVTTLQKAIILDLDGTVAFHPYGRDPFDHSQIPLDIPNKILISEINALKKSSGYHILIVTGRSEVSRDESENWLSSAELNYDKLFMRPADEKFEHDYIIKKKIYEDEIKDKYFITCVYEDREQLVEMWRSLNLITYQIDFGRF